MRKYPITASTIWLLVAGFAFGAQAGPVTRGTAGLADGSAADADLQAVVLTPIAAELKARLESVKGSKAEESLIGEIKAYYEARRFEPIWIVAGQPTVQALALANTIANARLDGLDPDDYNLLDLASASRSGDVSAVAEADLSATLAGVRYTTHLAAGRIRPRSLSRHVTSTPEKPPVAEILTGLSSASDVKVTLQKFEPQDEQYWALKDKLADLLSDSDETDQPEVPAGKALRLGSFGQRVTILRQRLGHKAIDGDAEHFDEDLLVAVKAFQNQNGLRADGIVGRGTLAVLNRDSRGSLISLIGVNLERRRWLPKNLGTFHIAVNIPEYQVRVNKAGRTVHTTRVVVGKRSNPTPIFSDVMEHIIVNPSWNVPASILSNEMLPDIMIDPSGFFSRNGYQLLARGESWSGFRQVHPEMVDWFTVDPKRVLVRQPPGRRNALGRIKFMFPNRHAVYLHDTPAKNLFSRETRAYSHGCVRVEDPMAFADAVLSNESEWDSARLKKLYGDRERKVELAEHIPVHLTYFTARVGSDGTVETFADVYGYDSVIRKLNNR